MYGKIINGYIGNLAEVVVTATSVTYAEYYIRKDGTRVPGIYPCTVACEGAFRTWGSRRKAGALIALLERIYTQSYSPYASEAGHLLNAFTLAVQRGSVEGIFEELEAEAMRDLSA